MFRRELEKVIIRNSELLAKNVQSRSAANFLQRQGMRTSIDASTNPVQDAPKQQGVNRLVQEGTSSSPFQSSVVEYARGVMFGNRPFSTSSKIEQSLDGKDTMPDSFSADPWPPKSLRDLHPSEAVVRRHEQLKNEIWREVAKGEQYELFLEQLKEHAKKTLRDAKLCRIDLIDEAIKFLKEQRYRGHHEKYRSGDPHLDPGYFAKVQNALFGYPETTPDNERPIYAFVTNNNYGVPWRNFYGGEGGGVISYLKSRVKDYATVIGGDSPQMVSFDQNTPLLLARPAPFRDPDENIWPLRVDESAMWNPLRYNTTDTMPIDSMEAALHRCFMEDKVLNPRRDTARILIRTPRDHPEWKVNEIIRLCRESDIELDFGRNPLESWYLRNLWGLPQTT